MLLQDCCSKRVHYDQTVTNRFFLPQCFMSSFSFLIPTHERDRPLNGESRISVSQRDWCEATQDRIFVHRVFIHLYDRNAFFPWIIFLLSRGSSSKTLILSGGYVRLSLSYDREKMSTFELKEKSPRCHNSVEITLTGRKENGFLQFKLFLNK